DLVRWRCEIASRSRPVAERDRVQISSGGGARSRPVAEKDRVQIASRGEARSRPVAVLIGGGVRVVGVGGVTGLGVGQRRCGHGLWGRDGGIGFRGSRLDVRR
ncbi:hypothetical protein VIGAN_02251200, partial [Vigna angularis var. angularis]